MTTQQLKDASPETLDYLNSEGEWVETGTLSGYVTDPRDGQVYTF